MLRNPLKPDEGKVGRREFLPVRLASTFSEEFATMTKPL